MNDYTPRDFFIAVRDAKKDLARKQRIIESMEAQEQSLPGGMGGGATHGGEKIANAITDIKLDKLAAWKEQIESDADIIATAYKVLYGANKSGGLDMLLGAHYAELLDCRYIQLFGWEKTARKIGYSRGHCFELQKIAFDFLESNGLTETAQGVNTISA